MFLSVFHHKKWFLLFLHVQLLYHHYTVLLGIYNSFSCHNKLPQMKRIKKKRNLFSAALDARSLNSRYRLGGHAPRDCCTIAPVVRELQGRISPVSSSFFTWPPLLFAFSSSVIDSGLTWSLQDDLISRSSSRSPKTLFPYKFTFIGFG